MWNEWQAGLLTQPFTISQEEALRVLSHASWAPCIVLTSTAGNLFCLNGNDFRMRTCLGGCCVHAADVCIRLPSGLAAEPCPHSGFATPRHSMSERFVMFLEQHSIHRYPWTAKPMRCPQTIRRIDPHISCRHTIGPCCISAVVFPLRQLYFSLRHHLVSTFAFKVGRIFVYQRWNFPLDNLLFP